MDGAATHVSELQVRRETEAVGLAHGAWRMRLMGQGLGAVTHLWGSRPQHAMGSAAAPLPDAPV